MHQPPPTTVLRALTLFSLSLVGLPGLALAAPAITDVAVLNVARDSALVVWKTGTAADAVLEFGETPKLGQTAMDWLWEFAWIERDQAFYYRNPKPYDPPAEAQKGAPDLNLLIAPAFAWLYRLTGDPSYRERGDRVFAGGVKGAWLGGGKQFSQSYRWSFDYVHWRRDIPLPGDKTGPRISDVAVEKLDNGDVLVKWKADEPAIMRLRYGDTAACDKQLPPSRYLVTSWSQRLRGLAAGKPCHFRISASDASGNTTAGKDMTF